MGVESYGRWAGLVGKSNGSAVHTMFLSTLTGRELPLSSQYIRGQLRREQWRTFCRERDSLFLSLGSCCRYSMKRSYTVLIIPGEPDEGGYWVKVPTLPGCITQGETVEEALANSKEAIEAYILSLKDRGLEIPEEGIDRAGLISTVSVEV